MKPTELVDLKHDKSVAALLGSAERVGVDTEFMREKTYFAELCLVQLAIGDRLICADPLGASDLSDFWSALMRCEWVVHSGRQDMEVAWQASGALPRRVFDTQVAAALLGYAPQIGYAPLVTALFGIELAKSHTRADWSRRPLSAELLHYAAEDVEYLLPAFDRLTEQLERRGRLSWAEQDSMDLLDATLYSTAPDKAIDRIKAAKNLRGHALAVAAGLAAWREEEAVRRNRPRQWILRDAALLEIAKLRPTSRQALLTIEGVAESTVGRAGAAWLDIVSGAADEQSPRTPLRRLGEDEKAVLNRMLKAVAAVASELGISAETVASRKELGLLFEGRRDLRALRGWRGELIGRDLLAML